MRTIACLLLVAVALCAVVAVTAQPSRTRVNPLPSLKARVVQESAEAALAQVSESASSSAKPWYEEMEARRVSPPGWSNAMMFAPTFLTNPAKGATVPLALPGAKLVLLKSKDVQPIWTTFVACWKKCFEGRVAKKTPYQEWKKFAGYPASTWQSCSDYLYTSLEKLCRNDPKKSACSTEQENWRKALYKSDKNLASIRGC